MNWEPWTGHYRASESCVDCYLYRPRAKRYGQNMIEKTDKFDWPIREDTKGGYNIKGNKILATCLVTDSFLSEADEWRKKAWAMIKEGTDIGFLMLTKRIDRFLALLPSDWGDGYDNINIGCTVESQKLVDGRLSLSSPYPTKRRFITYTPLLGAIDLTSYPHRVGHVNVGGGTGRETRGCSYSWVSDIREQCVKADVTFRFRSMDSLLRHDEELKKINPSKETRMTKELGTSMLDGRQLF